MKRSALDKIVEDFNRGWNRATDAFDRLVQEYERAQERRRKARKKAKKRG